MTYAAGATVNDAQAAAADAELSATRTLKPRRRTLQRAAKIEKQLAGRATASSDLSYNNRKIKA